ncbi:MAG: hypothetical protein KA138_04375, partial [Saprospiraceae bacterium]|nr:hypothetical protein [Saprospiraceae bacterium]
MRWNLVFSNLCLALNCLCLFLASFGTKMELPAFLQVAGRMHPLVLHFPIVLLLLACIWEPTMQANSPPLVQNIGDGLLLSSAVSAAISALMGLFLSKEGGYEENTLFWHQWSGIAVSVIAWGWYSFREFLRGIKFAIPAIAGIGLIVLLIAGHQGATLTHGENYLLAPVTPETQGPVVLLEDALVFEHVVRPILKEKCMNCHNSAKSKGDLKMETEALLLKGGKNGVLWDSTAKHLGLLLQRIHLPLEEKEHMPPKGKPQLTVDEISILYHWIKNGAIFSQKITDLPENDTLALLANNRLKSREEPPYPFAAADEAIVQQLNNDYRVVPPIAMNSPALEVNFYGNSSFKSAYLKELE